MTKYLEIGQIVNTGGIKGMVKVKPFTDDIKIFDRLKNIYLKNKEMMQYEIEEIKYHKNMVLIKLKGIDSIEQANALRETFIVIDREDEEPLEEGTYCIVDLLGVEVYTDDAGAVI